MGSEAGGIGGPADILHLADPSAIHDPRGKAV